MASIATIGVYGFDRDSFLAALADAGIDLLLDVRQRRGVRGSEYAWANARRLQAALAEAGIGYTHLKELAPTTELRELQYREDDQARRGQALPHGPGPRVRPPLHRADPRPRRPGADRADGSAAARPPCSASSATPRPATAP